MSINAEDPNGVPRAVDDHHVLPHFRPDPDKDYSVGRLFGPEAENERLARIAKQLAEKAIKPTPGDTI